MKAYSFRIGCYSKPNEEISIPKKFYMIIKENDER